MSALMGGIERPFSLLSDRVGGEFVPPIYHTSEGTWVAPDDGVVELELFGGAASGSTSSVINSPGSGGSGGAFARKRILVRKGDQFTASIGVGGISRRGQSATGQNGTATEVTLPDGSKVIAGGGSPSAGGVATGGDENVSGTKSATPRGGGAGAPSVSTATKPGEAGISQGDAGGFPGGGGAGTGSNGDTGAGGAGSFLLIFFARARL